MAKHVLWPAILLLCAGTAGAQPKLIPPPQQVTEAEQRLDLAEGLHCVLAVPEREDDLFAAEQLAQEMELAGLPMAVGGRPVHIGNLSDADIAREVEGVDLSPLTDRGPEAYLLRVEPGRIVAAGNGPAGTFYAIQTLNQLIRANREGTTIPCVTVLDWPGLRYRGYSDDISRGPIPTMDFFKRQIRTMAQFKMNMLTFYTEHVFKLDKHPIIAPEDGITREQVAELSEYARKYHVELVGNFQSFGHFWQILRHEQYAHLRETAGILTPAKEESYQFLDEVYSEIAPAYNSDLFNVNCDETQGLGEGPSKPLAQEIGVGGVYLRHMNRIHDLLAEKYGKRMMMWGDIALEHPDIVGDLAKDTILLSWGYGARENYDSAIEPFVNAGLQFMVCPGVSCWSRIFPIYDNAVVNIQNYVRDGTKFGAIGMLNTTWDDDGENLFHWNFYGTNWGAACAWRPGEASIEDYNAAYSQLSYGISDDKVVQAIEILTRCQRNPLTQGNSNRAFWVRPFSALATTYESVTRQAQDLCDQTGRALELLRAAQAEAIADAEDLEYLFFAGRRLHAIGQGRLLFLQSARRYDEAADRLPDAEPAKEALQWAVQAAGEHLATIEGLRAEYERLWLLENRPWWLEEMSGRYGALIGDLRAHHDKLAAALDEFNRTGVAPDPTFIGLELAETTRRNTRPTAATESLLPADAPWWDDRWPHRIALRVDNGDTPRLDYPVEVQVSFGEHTVAPASVRVVEYAGGQMQALATQYEPTLPNKGNVMFFAPGQTAAGASRTFAIYYDLQGTAPKPEQAIGGLTVRAEGGSQWVENSRYRLLLGTHGAHIFEWFVKALDDLEITAPGRGGWAGFADSGHNDRDAHFAISVETAGPLMARLRAASEGAGSEKLFTFYADRPYVEVMLAAPVGFYWDYDRVENFAADRGNPGTALFSNGHTEPVCASDEQIHAEASGVYWCAKTRQDGLLLANITPEVDGTHMTGPGGGWGGVGIERSKPAAHFVTLADQIEGDPAPLLDALRQTLDMRGQPRLVIGKVERR